MQRLVLLFFIIISYSGLKAQDPHFSQFYYAHSTVNPALVGVFEGKYRMSINYRNQWGVVLVSNPFETYSANLEVRQQLNNGDYFAFNVKSLYDKVGTLNYSQTYFHGGGAYHKRLASGNRGESNHYLSFGAQVGAGQNAIEWNRLWFGRQFDLTSQAIDRDLDSGEVFINGPDERTPYYLDINAGLLWYSVLNENNSVYAGFSAHHLNSPDIALVESNSVGSVLYRKWTGIVGAELGLNSTVSLLPAVVAWFQGPSFQSTLGTSFRFSNFDTDDMALRFGGFTRIANTTSAVRFDSAIIAVGFEKSNWILGLSYDFSLNDLAAFTQNRGAFELSFTYQDRNLGNRRTSKVSCPTF